jgi:3-hydroxy-9,10-secoandrosta-1,3,5(10)-triene-9,17-dione monooxygenase reductase component
MKIDATTFRNALGQFATGVTIVTTQVNRGDPVGITVNSFASVSLEPPMVLFSIAETSKSLSTFRSAEFAAVHVLHHEQRDLSGRFAWSGADKFSGMTVALDSRGCPRLDGALIRLGCRIVHRYPGGDHEIVVMKVEEIESAAAKDPLLFFAGQYRDMKATEAPCDDPNFGPGFWSSWSD